MNLSKERLLKMQNKCSRFKVTNTGIEIDSDSVPVANPTLAAYVTRWIYENFPITRGQKFEANYDNALSESPEYSCVLSRVVDDLGTTEKVVTITVKDHGVSRQ